MSLYLDTNVLVALFFHDDRFHERAHALLAARLETVVVSDFGSAEFAAVIARQVRTRSLTPITAGDVFGVFDGWTLANSDRAEINTQDVATAEAFLRRLDLNLRVPDAIHLAIAQRLGCELMTFDMAMKTCAASLKIATYPNAS